MSEAIQIHFYGEIIPGFDINQVKTSLARELAVELQQVEHWFENSPCVIRQCTSTAEANYFSKLCQKAGIRCQLAANTQPPDDTLPLITGNLSKVQIINSEAIKFAKQQHQAEPIPKPDEPVKPLPNSLQHIFFNENNWWFPAGLSLGLLCLVIAFFIAPDETLSSTDIGPVLAAKLKQMPTETQDHKIDEPGINAAIKTHSATPNLVTNSLATQTNSITPSAALEPPKTYLQLASFDKHQGAQRFIEQLQGDGYSIAVVEITNTGTIHHKVLVGPFPDDASYQTAKQAFISKGAPGFRVKL